MNTSSARSDSPERSSATSPLFGEGQRAEKMQGHWVLARAGKRVLRPGGLELTRRMLDALAIGPQDRVVEFAPGLGVTARMALQRHPLSYRGVERDAAAANRLREVLAGTGAEIMQAPAEESGLPSSSTTVVYGEAMLSMQSQEHKNRIFAEARRILVPGGRYAIHELCFMPEDLSAEVRREVEVAMAKEIHVGVQLLSQSEWIRLFEHNGFKVTWRSDAPMHLLEPLRVLRDEGFVGVLRFAFNIATDRMLRHRIFAMRRLFHQYRGHLRAISLVGQREPENA